MANARGGRGEIAEASNKSFVSRAQEINISECVCV